ncbi:MAG: glutamyl-tRNA reductase [Kofleriaceae bacterium]
MGEPFVVGISWRTAPVAVRERLAVRDDEIGPVLTRLIADPAIGEAMLVSTCNRVEIYGVARGDADAAAAAARAILLADRATPADAEVAAALYAHAGPGAVGHVFRVASALDSLVLGEAQILGQLKTAYQGAVGRGAAGPILGRCLERAFGVAKRTRTETAIARGSSNVSSVAVELAARVFGDLAGRAVLVVGAGKMSALAARHLRRAGVAELVVTNRSPERAAALAAELDAVARPWDELPSLLAAADVVISSTGARQPILTRAVMHKVARARRYRPLVVVDIAVPRDAEPSITDAEGIYLFDIDDLEKVVAANLAERAKAATDAARIVDGEAAAFEQWRRSQAVVPTIRALRQRFTLVAEQEVQRTLDALARREHTPAQRDQAIRRLGQLLVNKLLHAPQMVLKETPPAQIAARIEAMCAMFELELAAVADEPELAAEPPVDADAPPRVTEESA